MKTSIVKPKDIEKKWLVIDAKNQVLGRLATKIAMLLMGKHKPSYSPHQDCGDFVVVINAKDVKVTGKKEDQKMYRHHTGYPGGLKECNYKSLMDKKPEEIIRRAVKSMLPHNNLGRAILKHLKVCVGESHRYQAQQPVEITL